MLSGNDEITEIVIVMDMKIPYDELRRAVVTGIGRLLIEICLFSAKPFLHFSVFSPVSDC